MSNLNLAPPLGYVFIYKLLAPVSGEARFIGFTRQTLTDRLQTQMTNAFKKKHSENPGLYEWIKSLHEDRLKPEVVLIAVVPAKQAQHWVDVFVKASPTPLFCPRKKRRAPYPRVEPIEGSESLLTLRRAASVLGVSPHVLYRAVRGGKLPLTRGLVALGDVRVYLGAVRAAEC